MDAAVRRQPATRGTLGRRKWTGQHLVPYPAWADPTVGGRRDAADQHRTTWRGRELFPAFIRVGCLGRHVAARGGCGGCRRNTGRRGLDAAETDADRHPRTIGDGKASAAARDGCGPGGRRARNHRPSRGRPQSRTGVDPSYGRLSRHSGGPEEFFGARAARDCHAPLSQGCGGEPGGTALYPGYLQGDQGFTAGVAPVLPGTFGNGAKTLPPVAPHAAGTAGTAPGNAWYDIGYGDCDAPRFLAARSLCRQIPFPVRRVSVRHTARANPPSGGIRLRKVNSLPNQRPSKVEPRARLVRSVSAHRRDSHEDGLDSRSAGRPADRA